MFAVNPATSFGRTAWRSLGPLLSLAPKSQYKAASVAVFAATIPDFSQVRARLSKVGSPLLHELRRCCCLCWDGRSPTCGLSGVLVAYFSACMYGQCHLATVEPISRETVLAKALFACGTKWVCLLCRKGCDVLWLVFEGAVLCDSNANGGTC